MKKSLFIIAIITIASNAFGQLSTGIRALLPPNTINVRSATKASFLAAITKAKASPGDDIIYLPDCGSTGIDMTTTPIPVVSGISYIGVPPRTSHSSSVPDNDYTFTGGTWFKGTGVGLQAQTSAGVALDTDKGSADANFSTTGIHNVTIENIGLQGFSTGISVGAVKQAGFLYSQLRNIYIKDTTGWGLYCQNFQHTEFTRIWSIGCVNGQRYTASVASGVLQPGNSTVTQIFDNPGSSLTTNQKRTHRGIVFEATGGSNLNEIMGYRLQANFFTKSSTPYTASSGGTDQFTLAGGKGAELAVGMPVKFTNNGGNGNITTAQTYFVYSISTDTIKVSATRFGAAITGAYSSSTAITTYGFGNFEVIGGTVGSGGSAGTAGTITNCIFDNLDLEGVCQSAFSAENMSGCRVTINELFANPSAEQHIILRASQPNYFTVANSFTSDIDSSSVQNIFFGNRDITNSRQKTAMWFGRSSTSNRYSIGIGNADVSVRGANFEQREPSGGQFIYCLSSIGQRVHGDNGASTGSNINAGQSGVLRCTSSGAAAVTWNLPTIDSATVGLTFIVQNNRAGGVGATLSLTSSGSQYINAISAKNTVQLAAPSGTTIAGVTLIACDDGAGGNFYWRAILEAGATIP